MIVLASAASIGVHVMRSFRSWVLLCVLAVLCAAISDAAEPSISLVKATLKVSMVRDGEKVHRVWLSTETDKVAEVAQPEGFEVGNANSFSVQASFENEKGEPASVHQLFLRFVNQRTKQDNLYLVKRGSRDMRTEINLKNEIKGDAEFWVKDDSYAVELIMGDKLLKDSTTWRITEKMRFEEDAFPMFTRVTRGVFDFDVGVKKGLLPEFISPIPASEKMAPLFAVLLALASTLLPLPLLLVAWVRLGVFPLQFPGDKKEKISILAFQACLVAHLGALVMFWVKWNIVTTWKVMGVIMVPTLLFGRSVLSTDKAT